MLSLCGSGVKGMGNNFNAPAVAKTRTERRK